MDDRVIGEAAERVARARLANDLLTTLDGIAPNDVAAGYRVMRQANERLVGTLGPIGGFKIGATTAHMREHLGVATPVFGEMFASTMQLLSGQVALSRYRRLGIETEIAVVLARELSASAGRWTRESVVASIESVHACVELVDDRYDDFKTIGVATLAADSFFNAGCALGRARRLDAIADLGRLSARTILAGKEVASGTSDALLGHPLDALAWFANARADLGLVTPAGAVVTLGSITPAFWVERPMIARIEIEDLGAVDVHVEAR